MLIQFLGNDVNDLLPLLNANIETTTESNTNTTTGLAIVIAQQGVYQLQALLQLLETRSSEQTQICVLERDLVASGLISTYANNKRLRIISFEEFVTLSTQFRPCITIQS